MTSRELKRIFQKGECLSLETIRSYQQKKLPVKSMYEVEKHLLACSLCATANEGYSIRGARDIDKVSKGVQRRLAVYMNTPPRTSFFKRFGMTITGSFVVIGVLVVMFSFMLANRKSQPTPIPGAAYSSGAKQNPAVLTRN